MTDKKDLVLDLDPDPHRGRFFLLRGGGVACGRPGEENILRGLPTLPFAPPYANLRRSIPSCSGPLLGPIRAGSKDPPHE